MGSSLSGCIRRAVVQLFQAMSPAHLFLELHIEDVERPGTVIHPESERRTQYRGRVVERAREGFRRDFPDEPVRIFRRLERAPFAIHISTADNLKPWVFPLQIVIAKGLF